MRLSTTPVAALIVFVAAVAVAGGEISVALYALPLLALAALLSNGRFVGEERILAFHHARRDRPLRRTAARRWGAARPARVPSLHARSPRSFRGPPAAIAAV